MERCGRKRSRQRDGSWNHLEAGSVSAVSEQQRGGQCGWSRVGQQSRRWGESLRVDEEQVRWDLEAAGRVGPFRSPPPAPFLKSPPRPAVDPHSSHGFLPTRIQLSCSRRLFPRTPLACLLLLIHCVHCSAPRSSPRVTPLRPSRNPGEDPWPKIGMRDGAGVQGAGGKRAGHRLSP